MVVRILDKMDIKREMAYLTSVLGIPAKEVEIGAGSMMVLRNLKGFTHDLDIDVSAQYLVRILSDADDYYLSPETGRYKFYHGEVEWDLGVKSADAPTDDVDGIPCTTLLAELQRRESRTDLRDKDRKMIVALRSAI